MVRPPPRPPPFPTRRSSDLVHEQSGLQQPASTFTAGGWAVEAGLLGTGLIAYRALEGTMRARITLSFVALDRKSTRLNSSHLGISYAVFCLKKKKKNK